jgi:hypothetical protein
VRALLRPFGLAVLASTLVESCGYYGVLAVPKEPGATGHAAAGFGMFGGALHALDFAVLGFLWGLLLAEVVFPPGRPVAPAVSARRVT